MWSEPDAKAAVEVAAMMEAAARVLRAELNM
jgi:hypothetical protein